MKAAPEPFLKVVAPTVATAYEASAEQALFFKVNLRHDKELRNRQVAAC
jgi:hypothetical protein